MVSSMRVSISLAVHLHLPCFVCLCLSRCIWNAGLLGWRLKAFGKLGFVIHMAAELRTLEPCGRLHPFLVSFRFLYLTLLEDEG